MGTSRSTLRVMLNSGIDSTSENRGVGGVRVYSVFNVPAVTVKADVEAKDLRRFRVRRLAESLVCEGDAKRLVALKA